MPYKDPEKAREQHRRYREANPERERERKRLYHAANLERDREKQRLYRRKETQSSINLQLFLIVTTLANDPIVITKKPKKKA